MGNEIKMSHVSQLIINRGKLYDISSLHYLLLITSLRLCKIHIGSTYECFCFPFSSFLFSSLLFSSCLSCHQLNFAPLHHPIDGWKSKKTCVAIPQATITVPNIKILLIYSFPTFYSRSYYTLLSSKTCSLLNYLFEDLSLVLP